VEVQSAHPFCPYEQDLNENTNGLLRQYFPKSSDFELAGQAKVKLALKRLNTHPRKDLNVNIPAQLMGEYMVKNHCLTYDANGGSIHIKTLSLLLLLQYITIEQGKNYQ